MAARLMALDFQYLEIDGVEFDTYWQNGGYKKISDIIFAECHIFIVSNLCHGPSQCAFERHPPWMSAILNNIKGVNASQTRTG
jgi:hypothetical protein